MTPIDNNEASPRKGSVVGSEFKARYAERAATSRVKKGVDRRVIKQSNGDWMANELAALVRPTPRSKLDVPTLEAIFDANGVEHAHLSRTSPGWQGKLRMTGGLALRTIVANSGELLLPNGEALKAPKAWCDRWIK